MFNIFIDKINAIIYTQTLKTPHDLIFHLSDLENGEGWILAH